MNNTLVVVPTYNERENLPRVAQRILALPVKVDLLVVDGNSTDGTAQLADELAAKHPGIHVLHEKQKAGLGRAYISGFKWALERGYEFIFEMDGDISHDPDDIPQFLDAATTHNADLVLGTRYSNGSIRVVNWPFKRLFLSRGAGMYVRLITGMPFSDPTGGYKCFRRRALQSLALDEIQSNGYSFQIEMTHRLWREGAKIVEVPDRVYGTRLRAIKDQQQDRSRSNSDGLEAVAAKWLETLAAPEKKRLKPFQFPLEFRLRLWRKTSLQIKTA